VFFLDDGSSIGADAPRSSSVELAATGQSLTAAVPGGREILFPASDPDGNTAVIRALVTDEQMQQGVVRAWVILAALGIALLLVGLFVADRLAGAIVRPMLDLAEVSHRLGAGDLEARTAEDGPAEVREVARALNTLADRIKVLLAEERETVADISHRLRTPLTALRLDAEQLADPADAARIGSGVDALERGLTQVIQEARARTDDASTAATCDAAEVVRSRVDFWQVLAEDTDRTVTTDLDPGPLMVRVGAADLAACVDAVLGNVFAHTPDGTDFAVELARQPNGDVCLAVSDAGPGLSPTLAVLADGRPKRGDSGGGSTGLGLDIARRTAATSGGELTVQASPLGGTQVVLLLGGLTSH
jgi:signal transduction histidine kinase